jgi:hypothetical protein
MEIRKINPYRDAKYREFVRKQPCVHCGSVYSTRVAHHSDEGFHNKGTGIKAPDSQCVSLCASSCVGEESHHMAIGHNPQPESTYVKFREAMIATLSKHISVEYNVDPQVLIVNLLTEYIKK